MTENMKAFLDAIQNNEELKEKFDEISSKEQSEQKDYTDEYIALAREYGIILTKEDFEFDEEELSDEDLENVSGGSGATSEHRFPEWLIASVAERDKQTGRRPVQKPQSQEQTQDQN